MRKIEEVKKFLEKKGYETLITHEVKNTVHEDRLAVIIGTTCPSIYIDDEDTRSVEEIAEEIISIIHETPVLNPDEIMTREYIKENVFMALQKSSDEDIVKTTLMDLEMYYRIKVPLGNYGYGSMKATPQMLKNTNITKDELICWAFNNTERDLIILKADNDDVFIFTNNDNWYGASGIIFVNHFKKIAKETQSEELLILPMSVNEIMVVPHMGEDIEKVNEFVKCMVETQIPPEDRLTTHAYLYTYETDSVSCC